MELAGIEPAAFRLLSRRTWWLIFPSGKAGKQVGRSTTELQPLVALGPKKLCIFRDDLVHQAGAVAQW